MIYLVTGGAGFVGSSIAISLKKKYPDSKVIALDNLKRRGSEFNLPRFKQFGVEFIHGDVRNKEDLAVVGPVNSIIECSAEPSVMAGYDSPPDYLIGTNLLGNINCLEFARVYKAGFIMLSTSRVYPYNTINSLSFYETETRFELESVQRIPGSSSMGLTEEFPLVGVRSLYGATKLASELLILEYGDMYGLNVVINRCGILTGPWQFGKVDQGVVVLWVAKHFWKHNLNYIGFGGAGKQVRDILHVNDLFRLIDIQLRNIQKISGNVFNVGGGREISISLNELTQLCEWHTGNTVSIKQIDKNRPADIRIYLTDNSKVTKITGWKPEIAVEDIIKEIVVWIRDHEGQLKGVLG